MGVHKVAEAIEAVVDSRGKVTDLMEDKAAAEEDLSLVVEAVVPLVEVHHLLKLGKLSTNSFIRTENAHLGGHVSSDQIFANSCSKIK